MTALSICVDCTIQAIALLVVANAAPILTDKALGKRWSWPVDKGLTLRDGHRLFGDTKTWRGLCAAMVLTCLSAILSGLEPITGAAFGALTMVGDLLASFIKRRMGCTESSRSRGLDTLPESLLPTLLLRKQLALSLIDIALIAALFFLIEVSISPVLYRLHIRKRPY